MQEGGIISIVGYTGHAEGAEEVAAVAALLGELDPNAWTVARTELLNRRAAPTLIIAFRRPATGPGSSGKGGRAAQTGSN